MHCRDISVTWFNMRVRLFWGFSCSWESFVDVLLMRIFLGGLGLGVHWVGWCNMVIRLSPQRPGPNPASRNRHLINLPQSVSNQERRPKRKARIYFIFKRNISRGTTDPESKTWVISSAKMNTNSISWSIPLMELQKSPVGVREELFPPSF